MDASDIKRIEISAILVYTHSDLRVVLHIFRSGRKKNIRATATQEFARSISVPADRVILSERRQLNSGEERFDFSISRNKLNRLSLLQCFFIYCVNR